MTDDILMKPHHGHIYSVQVSIKFPSLVTELLLMTEGRQMDGQKDGWTMQKPISLHLRQGIIR